MNALDGGLSRLLDLLTARPNANELLKTLETDLLAKFKLSNAIIFTLDSHNISKEIYSNNLTLEDKTMVGLTRFWPQSCQPQIWPPLLIQNLAEALMIIS